jgi:archaellin
MKAPVPTDRVTQSAGRAGVDITELLNTVFASTTMYSDSLTYKEAILSPQEKIWETVIMDEYNSIIPNDTFSQAQTQFGNKPIEFKWVFKTKRNPDGSTRYRARGVIK